MADGAGRADSRGLGLAALAGGGTLALVIKGVPSHSAADALGLECSLAATAGRQASMTRNQRRSLAVIIYLCRFGDAQPALYRPFLRRE